MISVLIFLPAAAALLLFILPSGRWHFGVAVLLLGLLSSLALALFSFPQTQTLFLPQTAERLIEAADTVLLLYFLFQGIKFKSLPVMLLALLQMPLYLWAVTVSPAEGAAPLVVDDLSRWMFLIINIVGGSIVLYAVKYMQFEAVGEGKKRLFIAYLMLFLSVMNAIVVANALLLFFFLFEMTTLASYLLIGFRGDALSRTNALRALWMNQVGGVFLLLGTLVAVYGFGTASFSGVLAQHGGTLLLVLALLGLAAPVKGASLPFDGWLIGAMVAPTPVSAMLHSATMVKIAPFLLLKLAPALQGTLPGVLLALFGALTFTAASYLALSRSHFKEILGYSTIALLGLMMSLAAIGTRESMQLAVVLMLFHALSKALLFLSAGVLEKRFGLKDIEQMKGLAHRAPLSVGFVLFGFFSLTLPPFGLFMGKLFAIASVAALLQAQPWFTVVLLGIVVGSALLVLLYFKVAAALLASPPDILRGERESMPPGFGVPLALLALLTVAAAAGYLAQQHNALLWLFALPLLLVALLPLLTRSFRRFDRVMPYRCGEKSDFDAALFYAGPTAAATRLLHWCFGIFFAAVALSGALA
jgi:ech hydrogenase subunit A